MTKEEFKLFKKRVVDDPKGQQLFFRRAVFAAYDADGSGTLDAAELQSFIDIFYQAGSIFKGDARLPEKDELIRIIYERLDSDGDGLLTFGDLSSVISGSALRDLAAGAGSTDDSTHRMGKEPSSPGTRQHRWSTRLSAAK
jgi:Ca2+-binding EF-hand superfamily protein